MPVETLQRSEDFHHPELSANEVPPSLSPSISSETAQYIDNFLRLRSRYINLPPEDRNISPLESLGPQGKVELAKVTDNTPIPKWDMVLEMNRLFNDINRFLAEGMVLSEAVGKSAQELEINIRAFALEIIKSRPVLPHLNKFGLKEGVLRILGNNGQPVADGISAQERRGAVLDVSILIDNILPYGPNNTFAVLMSPSGWNGFTLEDGREALPYLNTQTLIFWKDQMGQLKGLTLHNDLKEQQASRVMESLGVKQEIEGQNERERLINIVRNPALLSLPQAYQNPFEYVLDKILQVRGNSDIRLKQQDGSIEIRSVSQIRADIAKFDQLLQGSLKEEELITQLKDFILSQAEKIGEDLVQRQIVDKIRQTILSITRIYLQQTSQISWYQPEIQARLHHGWDEAAGLRDDFSPEIAFLKTRAGCSVSGGGSVRGLAGVSLGSVVGGGGGIIGTESDNMGSLYFPCPHGCGKINKRPKGKLINYCGEGQTGGCGRDVRC